jgi:hypothetical protein
MYTLIDKANENHFTQPFRVTDEQYEQMPVHTQSLYQVESVEEFFSSSTPSEDIVLENDAPQDVPQEAPQESGEAEDNYQDPSVSE